MTASCCPSRPRDGSAPSCCRHRHRQPDGPDPHELRAHRASEATRRCGHRLCELDARLRVAGVHSRYSATKAALRLCARLQRFLLKGTGIRVRSGKRLATIYITHAHPDHFCGLKLLRDRFPEAQAIAPQQVVDAMQAAFAPKAVENWRRRLPGLIPSELAIAERPDGGTFDLEGREIVPIDIGHTDTDHTTCLHLPSIGLVIAGDAIYNGTHPYFVESNRHGLGDWLAAIDKIEALNPSAAVVGHGRWSRTTPHGTSRRRAATSRISFAWMTKHEPLRSSTIGCLPFIWTGSIRGRFGAAPTPRRPHAVPRRDDAVVIPQNPAPYSQRRGGPLNMLLVREELPCAANFADVTTAIAECYGVCSRCAYPQNMRSGRGPESPRITRYPKRAPPDLLRSLKSGFADRRTLPAFGFLPALLAEHPRDRLEVI
jgi:glyoxylase-like metal-dependent hydrolase (beta-lactamase superfamily II)